MKSPKIVLLGIMLVLGSLCLVKPAAAQSDILLRLRSGSPLGDRFRVDSAGGLVAISQLGIGIIPATGCGYRMMWYSYKAAFRAGGTDDGGACTYWDDSNVGFYSWAGGNRTIAGTIGSFAFGQLSEVRGDYGAAFGSSNTITSAGTVGFTAGASNLCSGFACVAMGYTVTAAGQGAVAIGYRVTADANYSVALGHRASANGQSGAFVIADQSTTDSLEASVINQFSSRYAGGYRLYTNATTTTGVSLNAGGSSWNVISDRTRKEDFEPLDGEDVLLRLRKVPVTMWRYRDEVDRTVRHIGPMAQDWRSAFDLTADGTIINMSDFDGVNLAAIQALERRTAALNQENAELRRRLDELETLIRKLSPK
jgi:trimeric autotransporter adhesin